MEPPSSRFITVLNETSCPIGTEPLKRAISVALAQHDLADAPACLLLTSDDAIRQLNRTYRSIDEETDVLTFPSGDEPPESIGDVAISVPYAARQAAARGVSLEQELGYLAIHGALHLAGLDDEVEADRLHMVQEMNRAAVAAGFLPDEEWCSLLHEVAHQDVAHDGARV